MSARQPRFEIVHSNAGWFARFVAANGRKVWQTEVYKRRAKAERAVELIVGDRIYVSRYNIHPEVHWQGSPDLRPTEVRTIDERGA